MSKKLTKKMIADIVKEELSSKISCFFEELELSSLKDSFETRLKKVEIDVTDINVYKLNDAFEDECKKLLNKIDKQLK